MKRVRLILPAGLLVLIVLLFGLLAIMQTHPAAQELSQPQLVAVVQSNLVAKLRVYSPPELAQVDGVQVSLHTVRGTFYQTTADGQLLKRQGALKEYPFFARVNLTSELELKLVRVKDFSFITPNSFFEKLSHWFRRSS